MGLIRDGVVDANAPAMNLQPVAVRTRDRCLGLRLEVHKTEPARQPRLRVVDHYRLFHRAKVAEDIVQVRLRRVHAQPEHAQATARFRRIDPDPAARGVRRSGALPMARPSTRRPGSGTIAPVAIPRIGTAAPAPVAPVHTSRPVPMVPVAIIVIPAAGTAIRATIR